MHTNSGNYCVHSEYKRCDLKIEIESASNRFPLSQKISIGILFADWLPLSSQMSSCARSINFRERVRHCNRLKCRVTVRIFNDCAWSNRFWCNLILGLEFFERIFNVLYNLRAFYSSRISIVQGVRLSVGNECSKISLMRVGNQIARIFYRYRWISPDSTQFFHLTEIWNSQ